MSGSTQRTIGKVVRAVNAPAAVAAVRGCPDGALTHEKRPAVGQMRRTVGDGRSIQPVTAADPNERASPDGLVTLRASQAERTIRWGEPWHLGSASFWVQRSREAVRPAYRHALGETLTEEVAACVLGGHGIRADIGLDRHKSLVCSPARLTLSYGRAAWVSGGHTNRRHTGNADRLSRRWSAGSRCSTGRLPTIAGIT